MKILYISWSKPEHSVNAVYIKGLRANNVDVWELFVSKKVMETVDHILKNSNMTMVNTFR